MKPENPKVRRSPPVHMDRERTHRDTRAPHLNFVAAGAALAAAQEGGASEQDAFNAGLAAGMYAGEAARAPRAASAEPPAAPAPAASAPRAKQPKEGFLRKLAHCLNLK